MDKFIIATVTNIDWHYELEFLPFELRFKFSSIDANDKIFGIVEDYIKQSTNQIAHSYDIECMIFDIRTTPKHTKKTICVRYGKITDVCE